MNANTNYVRAPVHPAHPAVLGRNASAGRADLRKGSRPLEAIALEEASLGTAVCMNSCAMEIWKNAFWTLGLGTWFKAEGQAVASCLDLEMRCLGLLTPGARRKPAAKATKEEVERGIDMVVDAFDNEILA
jgi:hypothetical protein